LLYFAYNQQVVFLLDEYDTPIQTAFFENYYEKIIKFFKPFLGGVLKDNDRFLKKAVITGILRVSGESMFSDLNNLEVCTSLDIPFSTRCGFTIDETKNMLKDFGLEKNIDEVINWYDGYNFAENTILNPWSLINYVKKEEFLPYWINTSSNSLLKTMIENSEIFREDLEVLLNGGTLERMINPNITFEHKNFYSDSKILYSFLFFSGYLKCVSQKLVRGSYLCKIKTVNVECKAVFENAVENWLEGGFTNQKVTQMLKALVKVDLETFELFFSDFVLDTLSFYDTVKTPENVYHSFLLGLLIHLNYY
jgi:hypothetical protein